MPCLVVQSLYAAVSVDGARCRAALSLHVDHLQLIPFMEPIDSKHKIIPGTFKGWGDLGVNIESNR
jgi:hypothetical protein